MTTKFSSLVYACLLGMITLGSTSSFAIVSGCPDSGASSLNGCSLPGTVDGSSPYFYQNVNVDYKQKNNSDDFQVKAKFMKGSPSSFFIVNPTDVFDISNTNFKLDAKVTDGVASGKIKLKGKIDALDIKGTLMTAELKGTWSAEGTLIGFDTMNIQCNDAINAYLGGGCTTDEVIYLNLLDAIGPDAGTKKIKTAGIALTSVPVPAAVWLFGTGLMGLLAVARRRGSMAQG